VVGSIALTPDVRDLVGSQMVPYIYDDYVSAQTTCDALMKMYEMGANRREEIGEKASQYAKTEFSLDKTVETWDKSLEETIKNWRSQYNRWEIKKI
jgi:flagellar capping protein FliD